MQQPTPLGTPNFKYLLLELLGPIIDKLDPLWVKRLELLCRAFREKLRSHATDSYWLREVQTEFPQIKLEYGNHRCTYEKGWKLRRVNSALTPRQRALINSIRRGDLESIKTGGYTAQEFLQSYSENPSVFINPLLAAKKYYWKAILVYIFAQIAHVKNDESPLHYATLHWAAKCGLLEQVVQGLTQLPVNFSNTASESALFIAASEGEIEVVTHLIAKGATVNLPNKELHTPIFIAAQNGHLSVVNALLAAQADASGQHNLSPIYAAAKKGHAQIIQTLTPHVGNDQEVTLKTPLLLAIEGGHTDAAIVLANARTDLDYMTPMRKLTALRLAVEFRNPRVVRALLEAGANVDLADSHADTPLHIAAKQDNAEITNLLLSAGANVNAVNNSNATPLHTAAENGSVEVARALLAAGANINQRREYTAVARAAAYGHVSVLKTFISCGTMVTLSTLKSARKQANAFKYQEIPTLLDLWIIKQAHNDKPLHKQIGFLLSSQICRDYPNNSARFFSSNECKLIGKLNQLSPEEQKDPEFLRNFLTANSSMMAKEKLDFICDFILPDEIRLFCQSLPRPKITFQ